MGNCHPEKTKVDRGDSRAVNNKYIVYITFCFKTMQVKWIFSVNSNAYTTPTRIYAEPYAHEFCTVNIFGISSVVKQYHPSPSNITRCQVPSSVNAMFHDSSMKDDIDFIECLSASQTQNILHWKYNIH